MKSAADLHLKPANLDADSITKMADLAAKMGLSCVGVTLDTKIPESQKKEILGAFLDRGITALSRIDLAYSNRQTLLRVLPKARSNYDLVAVNGLNGQISSLAFRDERIDIVFVDTDRPRLHPGDIFGKRIDKAVEFNFSDILASQQLRATLARARAHFARAKRSRAHILISSGARSYLSMIGPKEMIAYANIMGLSPSEAPATVFEIPIHVVRNRLNRRSPDYVAEGVMILEA